MVRIRPYRPADFDAVRTGLARPDALGSFPQGAQPRSDQDIRRMVAAEGVGPVVRFAIEVDGRVVGEVQYWGGPASFLPEDCYGLGVAIWDPADRGKGAGREAQRRLVGLLFDELGARRVQAGTNPANEPERRCLASLGFREEGVLRDYFPGRDGLGDMAMYGLLRRDWERSTSHGPQ